MEEQYFITQFDLGHIATDALLKSNIAYYESEKTRISVYNLIGILTELIAEIEEIEEKKW